MGTPSGRAQTRFPQSNSSISPLRVKSVARRQGLAKREMPLAFYPM
ncbi:hypothetical protein BSLA_01r5398 [Burkholderia stabilis]|nr:hypothetical protein BSLA_01r5398 [Burkholderia stabilis]